MTLTRQEIEAVPHTKAQLAAWGVPWPPPKGWVHKLIAGEPVEGLNPFEVRALVACPRCGALRDEFCLRTRPYRNKWQRLSNHSERTEKARAQFFASQQSPHPRTSVARIEEGAAGTLFSAFEPLSSN